MNAVKAGKLEIILTDFDGVILESEIGKTKAFAKFFSNYPDHVDAIVEYHTSNPAISRYNKLIHIYTHLLKEQNPEEKAQQVAPAFDDCMFEEVAASDEVPGAFKFLETFGARLPIFVISTTPRDQLLRVLELRNLRGYFDRVLGVPPKKSKIIADILAEADLLPSQAIYIGDSQQDLDAARDTDVPFIARHSGRTFEGPRAVEIDNFLNIDQNLIIDPVTQGVYLRQDDRLIT